jgi:hypothetical protein
MRTVNLSSVPHLEDTYHVGLPLSLYSYRPPDPPADRDEMCPYKEDESKLTDIVDRFNLSVAQRITTPNTAPDVLVTLEQRISCGEGRIPHVWIANVQCCSESVSYPSKIVAKIYDPVYFDSEEAEYGNPFTLRDLSVANEVGAYQSLKPLYGSSVPRFYGHFITPLSKQKDRTVNVILLELIDGNSLSKIIPPNQTETLCIEHKSAVIESSLRLFLNVKAHGIRQNDMQPRNIILKPSRKKRVFCGKDGCPLLSKADMHDLEVVMVDFENVEFKEPDGTLSDIDALLQSDHLRKSKDYYMKKWLKSYRA